LWRLRISNIAADIADGVIDVAVGDRQIKVAVEIGIEKRAAESQPVFGG